MPNGHGPALLFITKIFIFHFSYLRNRGFISVVLVDDSYLQGITYESCLENV